MASLLALAAGCAVDTVEDGGAATSAAGESGPTIAGFHYVSGARFRNDELFGANQGWALEVVQGGEDWQYAPVTAARDLGFRVIARIDQGGGMSVPARDEEIEGYANRHAAALDRGAIMTVVGNEPNLEDECRDDHAACDPVRYARIYSAVKARVGGRTVLAAGPSPDRADARSWLTSMQRTLGRCPDGFALHAYAGVDTSWPFESWVTNAVAIFNGQLDAQLSVINAAGCGATPVYITEFATQSLSDLEGRAGRDGGIEKMAEISRIVLASEQRRARTKAVIWFVGENRGGGWTGLAAFGQGEREELKPALIEAFRAFGRSHIKP